MELDVDLSRESPVWCRSLDWAHRVLPGKVIAARAGEHRELFGLASAVWIVLDEPATGREICDRISAGADIAGPTLGDVEEALRLMRVNGLVEIGASR